MLEFVDRVLVFAAVFGEKFVEFALVSRLDVAASDLALRSADLFVLDLAETFFEIG